LSWKNCRTTAGSSGSDVVVDAAAAVETAEEEVVAEKARIEDRHVDGRKEEVGSGLCE